MEESHEHKSDEYVRLVAVNATPNALTTREVEEASAGDEELREVRKAIEENGIQHVKTTPKRAQANGEVERQNASLMKRIRIAQAEGLDWKRELRKYATVYRAIDRSATGRSPAELLSGRKMRGKLPDLNHSME
ncbi:hypothetical protein SKAU_G00325850 [Synaphobranchus kaupii]|uniref:Integrase catalytic domain-containing protein n=1 Tax=Synaphobranchus kaupii TaxID=118154 RepID=A0A9Q1EPM1_SYNKA|nr:hypothetical protein SKAU_G00325850 [Synaphobranchus kaupii]